MKNGRQKEKERLKIERESALNRIQEETRCKIIKRDSEEAYKCSRRQMLQLNELGKLRADRNKAGLASLINKGN